MEAVCYHILCHTLLFTLSNVLVPIYYVNCQSYYGVDASGH